MSEDLRILPSGKGFESRYGNINVTITADVLEQLRQGKILHIDVDEYSVVIALGNEMGYEITFGDDSVDNVISVLLEFSKNCTEEIKPKLSDAIHDLSVGNYGMLQDNISIFHKVKDLAKDKPDVISAVDRILEKFCLNNQ